MNTGLHHLHKYWAYVALVLLIVAIINAILGLMGRKEFKGKDRKIALFALIATHIQLLIGLIYYFISPYFRYLIDNPSGVMSSAPTRLLAVEHPLINIIAIVFITIGFSRHKKATSHQGKFKNIAIFYLIGLALILSRIPWQQWLG